MFNKFKELKNYNSNVWYFVIALFMGSIVGAIFQGVFNNYLNDVFSVSSNVRGFLELPRELPGFFLVFFIGYFYFVGEVRLMVIATLTAGIGYLGLGYFSNSLNSMVVFMIIWSIGSHIFMIIREPLAMKISNSDKKGYMLGRINAVRSMGFISGTLLVWFFMGGLKADYKHIYFISFVFSIIAAIVFSLIKIDKPRVSKEKKHSLVFKKKYGIFYLLAVFFGVRKQLFIVFGPWLLVKMFDFRAQDIAILLLIAAAIGLYAKPKMGQLIDKYGERRVLVIDSILIITLSLGYALIPLFFVKAVAIVLLSAFFIMNELLFSLRTARVTYLYKIIDNKDDFTLAISTSFSIEHFVSMLSPIVAGYIWIQYGYYWVFFIAAFFALISGLTALRIKI